MLMVNKGSHQVSDSLLQFPVLSLTVVELHEEAVDHLPQVAVGDLELLYDDLKVRNGTLNQ